MSAARFPSARRFAAPALAVAILVSSGPASAADASHAFAPYLKLQARESDQSVDVGVQYAPTSGFGWVGRLAITAGKPNESLPTAELSTERRDVGLRLQLLWESPTGVPNEPSAKGLGRLGGGIDARWGVAKYEWNPAGGSQTADAYKHTFKVEVQGWLFGSTKVTKTGDGKGEVVEGTLKDPKALETHDYDGTLYQPQIRVSFTRGWKEADDSWVVQPAPATGPQLAEQMKISAPAAAATASVLLAAAFEPAGWKRFAFAPAVRFTTRGSGGSSWDPTGKVSRLRFELWGYLFGFGEETVRIGAAPFADVRTGGSDKQDSVVLGGVVELRTGTSRLEY